MDSIVTKRQHNKFFPSEVDYDTKIYNDQEDDLMFKRRDADADWAEALELLEDEIEGVFFCWDDEEMFYKGKLVEEIVAIKPNQYAIGWMSSDITLRDLVHNLEIRVTTKKRLTWS